MRTSAETRSTLGDVYAHSIAQAEARQYLTRLYESILERSAPTEEKVCRICSGTAADGRLISPCRCKGSMKYVHVECLNQWRKVATNRDNFFQCQTCKYKYKFKRTWFAGLLTNPVIVGLCTVLVLLLLIVLCGFFGLMLGYFFPSEEEDVGFLWLLIAGHRWAWYDFLLRGVTIVGLSGFAQLIFYIPRFGVENQPRGGRVDVMVLIIIVAGLIKVFAELYSSVREWSEYYLAHAESLILDVPDDDDDPSISLHRDGSVSAKQ
ncbi:hypothetical protein FOZ60_008663 [Perkinsus olseni]|uniref:RING-CH-type domain-containing protein n=1 Tax=Perkinsus olseni TaxID=32597 RepID=A0A7J6NIU3_PEROL|nr:hypothetical protein FOZ60_008663 [Perkinsus olseni]